MEYVSKTIPLWRLPFCVEVHRCYSVSFTVFSPAAILGLDFGHVGGSDVTQIQLM